jgi:hypothetical protein
MSIGRLGFGTIAPDRKENNMLINISLSANDFLLLANTPCSFSVFQVPTTPFCLFPVDFQSSVFLLHSPLIPVFFFHFYIFGSLFQTGPKWRVLGHVR